VASNDARDFSMHLRPTYPIETSRLRLRPLGEGDLEALLDYHSNPEVHRFLPMGPMDADAVLSRLESGPWSWTSLEDEGDAMDIGVEISETGELIGDVMLAWVSRRNASGEIGYVFNPRHCGNGFATEASRALLHLAFDEMGLHRVIARVVAGNAPSLALAERLGMRPEAHCTESWRRDDAWVDEVHLAILRSEWDAARLAPGALRDREGPGGRS
jgi:RimJ/RimL family protein N-acetyltransferase